LRRGIGLHSIDTGGGGRHPIGPIRSDLDPRASGDAPRPGTGADPASTHVSVTVRILSVARRYAATYADVNEADHARLVDAIEAGRLPATDELI